MPIVGKEDKVKKSGFYKEQPILINAKCGFHELGKFLSKMENADRFMKVSDINIKSVAQSPKKHDVELLIVTYTLARSR
jgi:Tfp pilus assembly protein PilO